MIPGLTVPQNQIVNIETVLVGNPRVSEVVARWVMMTVLDFVKEPFKGSAVLLPAVRISQLSLYCSVYPLLLSYYINGLLARPPNIDLAHDLSFPGVLLKRERGRCRGLG